MKDMEQNMQHSQLCEMIIRWAQKELHMANLKEPH